MKEKPNCKRQTDGRTDKVSCRGATLLQQQIAIIILLCSILVLKREIYILFSSVAAILSISYYNNVHSKNRFTQGLLLHICMVNNVDELKITILFGLSLIFGIQEFDSANIPSECISN